jgi:hypothetical protein
MLMGWLFQGLGPKTSFETVVRVSILPGPLSIARPVELSWNFLAFASRDGCLCLLAILLHGQVNLICLD